MLEIVTYITQHEFPEQCFCHLLKEIATLEKWLITVIKVNSLTDKYLDLITLNDDGRVLPNEEGLDADINYLNYTSTYSSTYKDLRQFQDFYEYLHHKNQLCIVQLNCRSIINNISEIHSFIQSAISIAPLQVLYYSEALPTTVRILYRSFTPKRTGNCR